MQDGAAPSVARTKVTVDLGARSYDILIGRDVLANAVLEPMAIRVPELVEVPNGRLGEAGLLE